MDAFSSIPNHTGFTARNLFMDGQEILRGGAFAKIAPGGGGPLSPHRHAKFLGDITARRLIIEEGGTHQGAFTRLT